MKAEFSLTRQGHVVAVRPRTDGAFAWFLDNVTEPARRGDVFYLDTNSAESVVGAAQQDGYTVAWRA